MKKLLLVLLCCVVVVFTGCLTPSTSKATPYDQQQDNIITQLRTSIQELQTALTQVKNSIPASGSTDVASLRSEIASLRTELSALNNAHNALDTRVKTVEESKAGTDTGNPVEEDSVLSRSGDLVLTLDRPIDDIQSLPDNSWSETIRMTVTNNGSSKYFRINADFDCDEDVQFATYPVLTLTIDNNSGAYMFFTSANIRTDNIPATVWPVASSTTSSLSFQSRNSSGTNKLWIGKGKTESIFMRLYTDYSTNVVREWDWAFTIKEVN